MPKGLKVISTTGIFYNQRINTRMSTRKKTRWRKTKIQNLWRHRSGLYYARFCVEGKDVWRSLRTDILEVARRRLPEVMERESGRKPSLGNLSVGDALQEALRAVQNDPDRKDRTKIYWREIVESILRSWKDSESAIHLVTLSQLKEWQAEYSLTHGATRSNGAIAAWRLTFNLAMEKGFVADNPAQKLKRRPEPRKDLRLPSSEEFEMIRRWVMRRPTRYSYPALEMIEFLAYSGMRLNEAVNTLWCHVDRKKRVIKVTGGEDGTKNRLWRNIPIIGRMARLLDRIEERTGIFPEKPILTISTCRQTLKKACGAINIPPLTHHDLRHLFATRCIESGVDIPTVSRWLGHQDGGALAMRIYGHLRDEHSQAMAAKVDF